MMLGLEEFSLFVNGMVGIVLSRWFRENVANFRVGDAHSRKQEVDWSHSSHWCFSVSSLLSLHAQRRAEGVRTDRDKSTWNMEPSCVEVETKRRPRDPGR